MESNLIFIRNFRRAIMKSLTNLKKSEYTRYPFLSLQKEIDQSINDFFNSLDISSSYPTDIEKLIISPRVDIIEEDKNFKVEVEMPGMSEENVSVAISDKALTIYGKKEISKKDEGKNYISREIGYGIYQRTIPLPDYVDTENAKATFKKGMLWVTFPKKVEAGKQQHEIKVEKAAAS